MCGILLVKSKSPISKDIHLASVELLKRRGPDFVVQKFINESTFVAQTVLHITGSQEFYHSQRNDGFAYNGEIYNYKIFGNWPSDVDLVYDSVKSNLNRFKEFEGTWAWGLANDHGLFYASDPQGEKSLYQYKDDSLLIVCSELAPILNYVKPGKKYVPYQNKSWTMISDTPWKGISRCEPGRLYHNGEEKQYLDCIWNWISPNNSITFSEAYHELTDKIQTLSNLICCSEPATLSYSGGIDSGIILKSVPGLSPVAIDIIGKDNIVDGLSCHKISIDEPTWAIEYNNYINDSKMPTSSWSFIGSYILAKHTKNRIIFTGIGADELFGGYEVYKTLSYTTEKSHSPYSEVDHNNLWIKCLNAYNGDPRHATLLMDYWYQVIGSDALGQDLIGGIWGKETRNLFLTKSIIKFALNLPWKLKVNTESKPLLAELYKNLYNTDSIHPKKGFAGHANDSLPYLDLQIELTGDRHRDWVKIAEQSYYGNFNYNHK